jgi:hypothetical protein
MDLPNSQLAITAAGLAGAAVVLIVVLGFVYRVLLLAAKNSTEHAETNRKLADAISMVTDGCRADHERQGLKLDAIHDDVREIKGHLGKAPGSQKAPHPNQHERQTP